MTKDPMVMRALVFIDNNIYMDIDVSTVCKHINFSRSYFSRNFRKETGQSIPEYVNRARIERAKSLLKNTGMTVFEISKSVGFDDQFYFSRVFKQFEGISPYVYKNEWRGVLDQS